MTGTSPPVEEPWEMARRILGYGISEAIAMARTEGIGEPDIKAAAKHASALLLKFSKGPKPPPPALRLSLRIIRPRADAIGCPSTSTGRRTVPMSRRTRDSLHRPDAPGLGDPP